MGEQSIGGYLPFTNPRPPSMNKFNVDVSLFFKFPTSTANVLIDTTMGVSGTIILELSTWHECTSFCH